MKITFIKRKAITVSILSLLFTLMQILGYQTSRSYRTTVHKSDFIYKIGVLSSGEIVIATIVGILFWFCTLYFLFTILENEKKPNQHSNPTKRTSLLLIAALLFICWVPCLLACYPGFYNYDAFKQIPQVLYEEVPYSAHHPLLHTLFVGNIIKIGYNLSGSLNIGILLHSIIQMIICALVFAYCIYYIFKLTGKRWLYLLAFCYYAFSPTIAMFTMSTTKDVLFSLLLQLGVIFFFEALQDTSSFFASRKKIARFVIIMVLMCLFRKNGIYIVICILPFVLFFLKKERKSFSLTFGSIILLYFIISKCLLIGFSAEEGSPTEALSIPIQQIARVYYKQGHDSFTPEEQALISIGIDVPNLEKYNPFLSDPIKNQFDRNAFINNKSSFFMLWLKKGLQYPCEYINAFIDNTYQAWYPGTSIVDDPYVHETYYFDMEMCAGGERDSKIPSLLEFYEKIANDFYYQKLPIVRLLFSIGAMFWIALFVTAYAIYKKNKPLYMSMLLVLFCCLTCFFGPISLVRYYLILFYGFPVNIGFLLYKATDKL